MSDYWQQMKNAFYTINNPNLSPVQKVTSISNVGSHTTPSSMQSGTVITNTSSSVDSFSSVHPSIVVPVGSYGNYDTVQTTVITKPGYLVGSTQTSEQYRFGYSPESIHKISIAGSIDNYDRYKRLLKENPGQATALGWGWGGLGNVDIAFYNLSGQGNKAIEKQIGQLWNYEQAKNKLSKGDVLGFSADYWIGYFNSPATQIGMAYGIGAAGGGIAKHALAKGIGAKTIGGQLAVRGIKIGLGGAIAGYSAYNVAEPVIYRGDWGEGLGRGVITAASFSAGGIGFEHAAGKEYFAKLAVIKSNQPTFTKEFVKNIPSISKLVQNKLPGLKPIGYFHGEGIAAKPIYSRFSMGNLLYKSYQSVGSTKFASNIFGWAAKGYVPAYTYVLNQQGIRYRNGLRYQDVTWNKINKGRVWIPKEAAMRFQSYIGDSGKIQINFPVSRDFTGGNINITGVVEGKSVKFGRNWFRRSYFSSTMEKDIEVWKPVSNVDMTGALGSYKPGGVVDVYKDLGVPKPKYSFFGEMVEKGYTFEKPIIVGTKGVDVQTVGVHGEMYGGFGSRYQPLNMPKSSTQWIKNIPNGIVKDVGASAGLTLRTDSISVVPKSFSSISSGNFMYVPVQSTSLSFNPYVVPISFSGNVPVNSYDVFSIIKKQPSISNMNIPVIAQIKNPDVTQIKNPDVTQIKIPFQSTVPLVTQVKAPIYSTKLILEPLLIKTPTIDTPKILEPTIPIPIPPPPFFLMEVYGGGGMPFVKRSARSRYKFRMFNVPSLDKLTNVNFNRKGGRKKK